MYVTYLFAASHNRTLGIIDWTEHFSVLTISVFVLNVQFKIDGFLFCTFFFAQSARNQNSKVDKKQSFHCSKLSLWIDVMKQLSVAFYTLTIEVIVNKCFFKGPGSNPGNSQVLKIASSFCYNFLRLLLNVF